MIYLIGGPPRMGKSTLAQELLHRNGFPYVSTDGLTVMLKSAGQPSFYSPEKSDKFYPYLDLFISRIKDVGPDYVIEGDAFSPEHVSKLSKKYEIKSVFLTMKHVTKDNLVHYAKHDRWIDSVSDDHLNDLVKRITEASLLLAEQCQKEDIACFDLSENYNDAFFKAYSSLIEESHFV